MGLIGFIDFLMIKDLLHEKCYCIGADFAIGFSVILIDRSQIKLKMQTLIYFFHSLTESLNY